MPTNQIETQVAALKRYNEAYRAGNPLVSDTEYDLLVEQLRQLDPDNPFLHAVEPEVVNGKKKVRHPQPMLSTEKAYTVKELERFVNRVYKEAAAIGVGAEEIVFSVTPKLDGLAGRYDGAVLATRGNGFEGNDISSAFDKGVVRVGADYKPLGEVVVSKSYFEDNLADHFEHPRNLVVGIISSDVVNEHARKALADKAVCFVGYDSLPCWQGRGDELIGQIETITSEIAARTDYPLDGMVVEITHDRVKAHMGATSHHYRWQIALKQKGEMARAKVVDITWQVGRTGQVTPVLEIEPTPLSGATIRRVTGHHAGLIVQQQVGPGAVIELIRSGEVIPKLEKVVTPSEQVSNPADCPVCGQGLVWENDFLKCTNRFCTAQVGQGLIHWFKILGTADWFGPKSIAKIVAQGADTLEKIYALTETDFNMMGFGPGQSKNLAEALQVSRTVLVEDWRFLAAFGIGSLGRGDSRNLLSQIKLEDIPNVSAEQIRQIHGFGEVTSRAIAEGVTQIRETMLHMLALGFNLERTPLASETEQSDNPIAGKGVVFTGKMSGSRDEMKAQARKLGANVQSAVSGKTNYLVCGERVGEKKMAKARGLGVAVVTESEYLKMIGA